MPGPKRCKQSVHRRSEKASPDKVAASDQLSMLRVHKKSVESPERRGLGARESRPSRAAPDPDPTSPDPTPAASPDPDSTSIRRSASRPARATDWAWPAGRPTPHQGKPSRADGCRTGTRSTPSRGASRRHRIPDPLSVPTTLARRITCKKNSPFLATLGHSGSAEKQSRTCVGEGAVLSMRLGVLYCVGA